MNRQQPQKEEKKPIVGLPQLLGMAHSGEYGKLTGILTKYLGTEEDTVFFHATVVLEQDGISKTFEGSGDANPRNCTKGSVVLPPFRMAETRSIVRALRWAVNMGAAAEEEFGDEPNVKQTSSGMVNTQTGEVYEAPRPKKMSEAIRDLIADCKGIKNSDFPLLCNRLMGHDDGDVVELQHTEWCVEEPKERWTQEWQRILMERKSKTAREPIQKWTGEPAEPLPAAATELKKRAKLTSLAKVTGAVRLKLNELGYTAGAREFLKRMMNWHDKSDDDWDIADYLYCLDQTDDLWKKTADAFEREAEEEERRAEFTRKAQAEDKEAAAEGLVDPFRDEAEAAA